MITRIVTYGCSYTQGIGLPDLGGEHPSTPSELAWPNYLADYLGFQAINKGQGGWSNKMVCFSMLRDLPSWNTNDILIVMWTCPDRHVVLQSQNSNNSDLYHMGIWHAPEFGSQGWPEKHPEEEAFFTHLYTSYDKGFQDLTMISAVNYAYNQAGIQLINVCTPAFDINFEDFPWFSDFPVLVFDEQHHFGDTECGHPNEQSHQHFAGRLASHIKNEV